MELCDDTKRLSEYGIYNNDRIILKLRADSDGEHKSDLERKSACNIDNVLVHILIYVLNDNEFGMEFLSHMKQRDINQFCREYSLSGLKKKKFMELMEIVKHYDDCQ